MKNSSKFTELDVRDVHAGGTPLEVGLGERSTEASLETDGSLEPLAVRDPSEGVLAGEVLEKVGISRSYDVPSLYIPIRENTISFW